MLNRKILRKKHTILAGTYAKSLKFEDLAYKSFDLTKCNTWIFEK